MNLLSPRSKDRLIAPIVYFFARLLAALRRRGFDDYPRSKAALLKAGVFPILNHYYEPKFDFSGAEFSDSHERELQGIDFRLPEQLTFLKELSRASELQEWLGEKGRSTDGSFAIDNPAFTRGDAEVWYQIVRLRKPRRVVEVGSGYSTKILLKALEANSLEGAEFAGSITCIEPYEMPWLDSSGVSLIRKPVESVGLEIFQQLSAGDILFIDSSHMIRPDGDVLYLFLEVLPALRPGVLVHVHDIFSPRNYPASWVTREHKFWNEQYLFEAFISFNSSWRLVLTLNLLKHRHFSDLKSVAPYLLSSCEPGSIYMERV